MLAFYGVEAAGSTAGQTSPTNFSQLHDTNNALRQIAIQVLRSVSLAMVRRCHPFLGDFGTWWPTGCEERGLVIMDPRRIQHRTPRRLGGSQYQVAWSCCHTIHWKQQHKPAQAAMYCCASQNFSKAVEYQQESVSNVPPDGMAGRAPACGVAVENLSLTTLAKHSPQRESSSQAL